MSAGLDRFDRLYIGGEWLQSGSSIAAIDPATEEAWTHVAAAEAAHVDSAVDAARAALSGPWSKMDPTTRGAFVGRLAELVRANADRLAEIESLDNGKPHADTKGELRRAADWLQFFAGAADKLNGDQIPYRQDALAYTRLEPVGVVAAIMPWNSPILLACWKLGPALATGNAVILKPSEYTPASMVALGALAEQAGFPAGVVNVLPGGREIGAALAAHPGVNKISFTGSQATATRIMESAARNLKRCAFECGGKSPFIVFADADIEKALAIAAHSSFRSTGQSCSASSRIFVERPVYEEFGARLAEIAGRIRMGPQFDAATHIGPQTSADQRDKTESYIKIGLEGGATLLAGGKRPEGFDRGYYVSPTVFVDVDNHSRLAREEIFGPVTAIMPFDDEDEAVALANDTNYGLVGGLWTSDVGRAHRVAARIESGLVSVNTFRPVHYMLPYGGYKLSGIGRENGMEAMRAFTETKTVVVDLSTERPGDPFP